MADNLTGQYNLSGVETKEDLLQSLEHDVDAIMGDYGITEDNYDTENELAELVLEFLHRRGRMTRCEVCGQLYVTIPNPDGCPYTDRSEHENHDDDE
jgi:hypothetical protein